MRLLIRLYAMASLRKAFCASLLASMLFLWPSCTLEQLFPDKVADGAARLSIANMGALLQYISKDTKCGFKNPDVVDAVDIKRSAKDSKRFIATYELKNCTIDFDARCNGPCVIRDCNDVGTSLTGKVTIGFAKQIRHGHRTADKGANAVIPVGDNAVRIIMGDIRFDNFGVKSSSRNEHMMMVSGTAELETSVHLAESKGSDGLCSVVTPNLTIHRIALENVHARMPGVSGHFTVPLDATLRAQVGKYKTSENMLGGKVRVWGEQVVVPADKKGLDPGYSAEQFEKELACIKDIRLPLSYNCDFDRFFAMTVARLLVLDFSTIAQESSAEDMTPKDKRCAFSFSEIKDPSDVARILNQIKIEKQENVNGDYRETTFALRKHCRLGISADPKLYDTYCPVGPAQTVSETYMEGFADIKKGRMKVKGETVWVGGLVFPHAEPRAPEDVSIQLSNVQLHSFSSYFKDAKEKAPRAKLVLRKGTLSGNIKPILTGKKANPQVFKEPTPVVLFENIKVKKPIEARLYFRPDESEDVGAPTGFIELRLEINASDLSAQNGFYNGDGNWLSGFITINGQRHNMKKEKLNPDYDQKLFDEAYQCREDAKYKKPISEIVPADGQWKNKQKQIKGRPAAKSNK